MNLNLGQIKLNVKPFIISCVAMFVMMSLINLGIKPQQLISPQKLEKTPIIELIRPKLTIKTDHFAIKSTRNFIPTSLAAADYEQAAAYLVTDFDSGEVIAQKNMSDRLPIASITKIMTAMVALDLASPEDNFLVSQKASDEEPSKLMLHAGEQISLEDLLSGALISSANDAAQAIADGIDQKYGENVFIDAMNAKAAAIGLKNSHFTNSVGLDDGQPYSSAEDVALMSHFALANYPRIAQLVGEELQDDSIAKNDERFYLRNWNGLLGVYPGTFGIKIGNTETAGYTTAVVSQRDGKKILVVLLGAPGVLERDSWASELLDLGFQKYAIASANITEDQLKEKYASWKRD